MKKLNILSVALLTFILTGCSSENEQQESQPEELVKSVNVSTQDVGVSTFSSYIKVVGTVETSHDIMISAEVSGKVESYQIQEGQSVRKGEAIVRLEDSKLVSEKNRLEAATTIAKENFERLEKIYQDGIGSEIDYLNAKYNYEQSSSALASIKVDLSNTVIKAPFNGRLESKVVEEGEMAIIGQPIFRIIGDENFKITAGVPARYASVIKEGDKVDIWFDEYNSETILGTITFVAGSINPQDRTFEIEVELPETTIPFKVDMIANVRLNTNFQQDVLVINKEYVYSKDDNYVVYVLGVDSDGHHIALEKNVTMGRTYKNDVIIKEGLELNEELITLGSAFLVDGMRVTVINKDSNKESNQVSGV